MLGLNFKVAIFNKQVIKNSRIEKEFCYES
jgi:hypothetical protein